MKGLNDAATVENYTRNRWTRVRVRVTMRWWCNLMLYSKFFRINQHLHPDRRFSRGICECFWHDCKFSCRSNLFFWGKIISQTVYQVHCQSLSFPNCVTFTCWWIMFILKLFDILRWWMHASKISWNNKEQHSTQTPYCYQRASLENFQNKNKNYVTLLSMFYFYLCAKN